MYNFNSIGVTPEQLITAMKGELGARIYYQKLAAMAPGPKEADIIMHFFEDETKHYRNFRMLYINLTGHEPIIPALENPSFTTYQEGVDQAILDELEAYDFYRDIYLSSNHPVVKNIFFEALTDESEHAAHLNYLFTKSKCK
ncbi:MAG TPA: ferritin-like domain-containing protein [Desulfobacteria bacterium]|nr:ferritin-like domain-containing protein [Desulfobacteria bacterium]